MKNLCKNLLITMTLLASASVYGQVGFNNPNPHASSILDLTASDKGLLIPRMTTVQRSAISSPADGLLVYQTDGAKGFYYHDGTGWYTVGGWVKTTGSSNVSLTGNVSVTGTVSATNYGLNSNGNGPVPAGGIIMWSGSIASIPTGWALCDGGNGTPDLRNRFIVGAGSSYGPGATGGANTVTLTATQIPIHNHTSGTLATSLTGAHTHRFRSTGNRGPGGAGREPYGFTEIAGGSIHTTSSDGSHNHTISGSTGNTGSGASHENRPPYYALAYIMKLP